MAAARRFFVQMHGGGTNAVAPSNVLMVPLAQRVAGRAQQDSQEVFVTCLKAYDQMR